MPSDDQAEISHDTLEELVSFADTHGDEYGHPDLYHAVQAGKDALGYENTEPYFLWRSGVGR